MEAMRAAKIGKGERGAGGERIRENDCSASSPPQHLEWQLKGRRGARIRENNFQGVGCGP